ncbi:hypothetical protein AB0873_18245 [Micromonospora sp. NPDC047707]|uniref:hypothetical protein n=1 Tax=Micromonospora sp. NPDC047707 TaxID=3154498 RepID=UPI0034541324
MRTELHRAAPVASRYSQMAGLLLGAGLAVLAVAGTLGHLSRPAVISGAATVAVVLTAMTLLMLTSRLRPNADHGFMVYANADDAQTVLARVAGGDADCVAQTTPMTRARELRWLSRSLRAKSQTINWAVPLLLTGYVGAAVTTALVIRWG